MATYDYPGTSVPNNTVKKGFDTFLWSRHKELNAQDKYVGGGDSSATGRCRHPAKKVKDVLRTNGRWQKGNHRWFDCSPVNCGNCDAYPEHDDYGKAGPISSVKVPIGLKVVLQPGEADNLHDKKFKCTSHNSTQVGWNYGDFRGSNWPARVPKDVAIGCSWGNSMRQNKFPKTTNNFKFKRSSDGRNEHSECWLGSDIIKSARKTMCTIGTVDWPTYCQLGDFVDSQEGCRNQCRDVKEDMVPGDKKHCEYALDRLCRTRKGDPLKIDPNRGTMINASKDYFTAPICQKYCGSAEDSRCRSVKNDICSSDSSKWLTDTGLPGLCKSYWSRHRDTNAMNKSCGTDLVNSKSTQNVFTNKGCGKLCPGGSLDVDKGWCDTKRLDYCTKNDSNMLTDECFRFCEQNPDTCDEYLSGPRGMCSSRLGIKTEDDLNKPVLGTNKKYSDWCGCMMHTQFYEDYADGVLKKFNDLGYSVSGHVDLAPECMYPKCKGGSIKDSSQQHNLDNGECKSCVQIMLQNITGNIVDSDIASHQSAKCANIRKRPEPPASSSEPPPASSSEPPPASSSEPPPPASSSEDDEEEDMTMTIALSVTFTLLFIIIGILAITGSVKGWFK